MKLVRALFCSLVALIYSSQHLHADDSRILTGSAFFSPRSENSNTAKSIIQWKRYIIPPGDDRWHPTLSFMPEYTRSFRPDRLAEYFFGTSTFGVSGSQSPFRGDQDFLADYFGLSPAFSSQICLKPFTQSAIIQTDFYVARGAWYGAVHVPIVWKETDMGMHEIVFVDGHDVPFPADYMTSDPLTAPFISFTEAIQGFAGFGDVERLRFGKIACGKLHKFDVADVNVMVGWNCINYPDAHFGITAHMVIPTGNRSSSEFLFEPIVGNGHHWEFGLGFTGHKLIWQKGIEQEMNVVVETVFTHLFASQQRRSFDFKCKFGSRYILAKQFDQAGQYTRHSLPAINVTTSCCDISADLQMDLSVMIAYRHTNLELNVGYNGWFRTHEKSCNCTAIPSNTYALKGIQNVTEAGLPSIATQSTATLHGNDFADQALVADPNPPVFFSNNDIDRLSAGSPLSYTSKGFWHMNYMMTNSNLHFVTPYVGLGGEVEFEGFRPKNVAPNKDSLAQWGIWGLLGFTY